MMTMNVRMITSQARVASMQELITTEKEAKG